MNKKKFIKTNEQIIISIITICFNEKKNIQKTCESIISQNLKNYEWIVIDGGSTDGTIDKINKYKNKINKFISEEDNGIYDAMNKGIKLAKGEWIIFMNGGDCFYNKESLKDIFKSDYNYDIIFADGINDVYNTKHPLPINKKGKIILYKFFTNHSLCHQATFIRRSLFKKVGLYDTNYKIIADHVFNYIAFKKFKVKYKYIKEITALIDISGVSMISREKMFKELSIFKKEQFNIFIELLVIFNRLFTFFIKMYKKYV